MALILVFTLLEGTGRVFLCQRGVTGGSLWVYMDLEVSSFKTKTHREWRND
jgi:hypothetical protein